MGIKTVDFIECPHCGYQHTEYDDYLEVGDVEGQYDMLCERCKEPISVDFYSVYYFTATKGERGV